MVPPLIGAEQIYINTYSHSQFKTALGSTVTDHEDEIEWKEVSWENLLFGFGNLHEHKVFGKPIGLWMLGLTVI